MSNRESSIIVLKQKVYGRDGNAGGLLVLAGIGGMFLDGIGGGGPAAARGGCCCDVGDCWFNTGGGSLGCD